MNYDRLYEYRFREVDQRARERVWGEISSFVHDQMRQPQRVLDPAAGRCEFINAIPAAERWAVDRVAYGEECRNGGTHLIVSDIMEAELPRAYFDGVWVSNFLEHLPTQEHVADFLERMRDCLRPGGRIAIMGPNFRFCADEYFDCADHTIVLTHVGAAEHVYAAGFEVERLEPKFLPYSFRGHLPPSAALTRLYLRFRPAWRLLGKQFLVIGRRVEEDD